MGAITSHYNLAIIIQEQRRGNAVRDLKKDLTLVNQRLDKHGVAAGQAASKTEQFVTKTKRLGTALRKVLVPALLLAATSATKFGTDSFKAFAQFDKGMQEVFTLIPDRTAELERELTKGIKAVGAEFGYLTEETIPALYQALSAGVPEDNAIAAVELAAQAAKAGASDLESTMRIGMAVVNAYGGEIYTLGEAYDLIFQLVDKGVPRLSDWGSTLQDVISIASEARTPFEDIVAALAVMTRQGDSAAEAAELLGFILMQMQIEGTTAAKVFMEATGTSYREWIATGNGLVDGLIKLDEYAIQTGQHLDSMIGGGSNFYRDQQAARGTMELTGLHLQELIDLSKQVGDEAEGSMKKAYGTASDNAQQALDEMAAKWETIKLNIGEAIWEQKIFLGMTGQELLTNVGTVAEYASGATGEKLIDNLNDAILAVDDNWGALQQTIRAWVTEDRTADLPWPLPDIELFEETYAEGNVIIAKHMTKYYQTAEEWMNAMSELGIMDPNVFMKEAGSRDWMEFNMLFAQINEQLGPTITGLEEGSRARAIWAEKASEDEREQLELLKQLRQYGNDKDDITQARLAMNETLLALDLDRYVLSEDFLRVEQDSLSVASMISKEKLSELETWERIGVNMEDAGQMIHWMTVETQALNQESLAFMDTVFDQGKALTTAFADLQEAGGDWTTIIRDNGAEISTIMSDLATDLSDDERSIMQAILKDSEEGGSDWLSSWRRLQSDLTETQRNELVARLADLQASQGNYEGVWTGDREKAETAAKAIIAAFEAIDEAYYTMGENMVTNKILTDIRLQDTVAGQQAMLAWQVALGNISEPVAAAMQEELEKAALLEPILDEMYTAYMADGKLAEKEARAMIKAIDILGVSVGDLTTEGVQALLDKQLSEEGGYPRVAGVIRDDLGQAMDEQAKKQEELAKKPIVPEVGLNKTNFDILYEEMMIQINEALGPWSVEFNAQYNDVQPNEEQATGTGGSYRTVPGGFPNDSYLIGLTSGEQFAVLTPGQQRRQGGGRQYIDQSSHTTNIYNHTAAAAAVSRAYLDTLYDQRLRRFAGD